MKLTKIDGKNRMEQPQIFVNNLDEYLKRMRRIVFFLFAFKSKNGGTPTTNS